MDVSELARAITQEVLRQLRTESRSECAMVLGPRDAQLAITVKECVGEETEVLFAGDDTGGRTPARYILPFLSCCAMAALASGAASEPMPAQVLQLLLSGVQVEILEFEYRAYSETAPEALYSLYESCEKTLATYGLVELRRPQPDTVRVRDRLVTEKTVSQAGRNGASVLLVPQTALVTPLAAEAAGNLNITILKRL